MSRRRRAYARNDVHVARAAPARWFALFIVADFLEMHHRRFSDV